MSRTEILIGGGLAALAALVLVAAAIGFRLVPGARGIQRWLGSPPTAGELRAERIDLFESERNVPRGTVVFLGSSTIERFPLARCFPDRPTANRGIGDETVPFVSQRLARSLPEGQLGGIVVYAGSVDFRRDGSRVAKIVENVDELLGRIAKARPDVPVCFVAPMPERAMPAGTAERLAGLETRLREVCERRGVAFVETDRPPLLDATGLSEAHSVDRLHLNDAGYDVLARWIVEDGGPAGRALAR